MLPISLLTKDLSVLSVIPEINWLAVIASTLVFAVLGGVYFTAVVGTPYRVALGNEDRELPRPSALFIVGPLISSLLVVATSAVLLRALDIDSVGDGVVFALVIAIGYLVAQTLTIAINPNFPRPLLYTLINAPYFIACTVIACIILTAWQ